jgi:hypothetical protein
VDENNGNWQNWQRENKQRKSEETLEKGLRWIRMERGRDECQFCDAIHLRSFLYDFVTLFLFSSSIRAFMANSFQQIKRKTFLIP